MRTLLTISAFSLLICVACNKSGEPSCTDEATKKLVLDISTQGMREALLPTALQMAGFGNQNLGTYDDLNKIKNDPGMEEIREVLSTIDKQVTEAKMSLGNIRINKKDDDIKKCACGGDLAFASGKSIPITYTVQFTEEGKTYVEVSGL